MKQNLFRKCFCSVILMLVFGLLSGCANKSEMVGKWREIGRQATLEFREDGTFLAVDNQGLAVNGNYYPEKDNKVRFEISGEDFAPETLYGKIIIIGDELDFISEDGSEMERYKRVK